MATEVPVQNLILSNIAFIREATLAYLPKIALAIGLVLAGWLLAKVVSYLIKKIANGLDSLLSRINIYSKYAEVKKAKKSTTRILANISFWLVFIFFIVLAIQALGFTYILPWMKRIANFIPSFIICALIILFGYIISRVVRESIIDMTSFEHNVAIARLIGGVIIFIAVLFGIQQLSLNISFLIRLFNLTYGIALAGLALAIALSVYRIIADLILMKMITSHLSIGQSVEIADFKGKISAINSTCITLTGREGDKEQVMLLPAKYLSEYPTRIQGN